MARNPRAQQDPAEAALSAIEEALNMGAPESGKESGDRLPTADTSVLREDSGKRANGGRSALKKGEDSLLRRTPANDDRESVGQVLQALQRKPPRTPYFIALILAAGWVAAGIFLLGALANFEWGALFSVQAYQAAPGLAGAWVGVLLPPFFFLGLASLVWRAQESSYLARATSQIAIRLIQPETLAADTITTVSQAVRREVEAISEGVERALARASELELAIHNEVTQLERSYSSNEIKMRSIVEDLASQREAINSNAEKVRSAIVVAHEDLTLALGSVTGRISQEISEAGYQVMRTLGERGTDLSLDLNRAGDTIVEAMTDRGSAIIERMTVTADEVNRALASSSERVTEYLTERAGEITGKMTRTADVIHETFASRALEISDTLTARATALNDTLVRTGANLTLAFDEGAKVVTGSIRESSNQMIEQIASSVSEVNNTLRSTGDALLSDLQTRSTDMTARLDEATTRIAEIITIHGSELADQFAQTGTNLHESIVVHGNEVVHRLADTGQSILDQSNDVVHRLADTGQSILAQSNEVVHQLTVTGQSIVAQSSELAQRLAESGQSIVSAINEHLGETLSSEIGGTIERLQTAMDGQATAVTNAVENRLKDWEDRGIAAAQQVETAFDKALAGLDDRFSTATSSVQGRLDQSFGTFEQRFLAGAVNLQDSLEARVAAVQSLALSLVETTEKETNALAERIERIDSGVQSSTHALSETLSRQTLDLARILAEGGKEVVFALDGKAEELSQSLANLTVNFEEAISRSTTSMAGSLENRSALIVETFSSQAVELTARLDERSALIAETLSNQVIELTARLDGRSAFIADTLATKVEDINRTLGARAMEVAETLDSRVGRFEEIVMGRLTEVSEILQSNGYQIAQDVATNADRFIERTTELNATIGHRSQELTELLDARTHAVLKAVEDGSQSLLTGLAHHSQEFGDLFHTRTYTIMKALEDESHSLLTGLSQRNADLVTALTEKREEIAHAMDTSVDQLSAALETRADRAVTELAATSDRVRVSVGSLLERMSGTNGALRDTLEESTKSLDMIEVALTDRLRHFHSTMVEMAGQAAVVTDQVNDQVTLLRNISNSVLTDMAMLTRQLEERGNALTQIATSLDHTQSQVDRSLDERRGVLEEIVATISDRTDSMGQLLNAFSTMIDTSLANAETKTQQVSTLLAENAAVTVQTLGEQFEIIRDITTEERERTSQAMRAAYEQAINEVSTLFGGTFQRFTEIVGQLKNMTASVQQDLEATRSELQHGLIDLPHQATDHITTLRRVVAEQIQALNELSGIVTRAGRAVDVPERLVEAVASPKAAANGAAAMPYTASATPRAETRPAAPSFSPPAMSAAEARPVSPPPSDQPEAPEPRQSKGWIADLLARASRDDQLGHFNHPDNSIERPAERAAAPSSVSQPESPQLLLGDISALVNEQMLNEIWDRYRRGERNVFSRRIYTIDGQQSFEEIRRRYRQDQAFRDSTDRYIEGFESLLGEVGRDDPTGASTTSVLVSDEGKIYTILAHAVGRLA